MFGRSGGVHPPAYRPQSPNLRVVGLRLHCMQRLSGGAWELVGIQEGSFGRGLEWMQSNSS